MATLNINIDTTKAEEQIGYIVDHIGKKAKEAEGAFSKLKVGLSDQINKQDITRLQDQLNKFAAVKVYTHFTTTQEIVRNSKPGLQQILSKVTNDEKYKLYVNVSFKADKESLRKFKDEYDKAYTTGTASQQSNSASEKVKKEAKASTTVYKAAAQERAQADKEAAKETVKAQDSIKQASAGVMRDLATQMRNMSGIIRNIYKGIAAEQAQLAKDGLTSDQFDQSATNLKAYSSKLAEMSQQLSKFKEIMKSFGAMGIDMSVVGFDEKTIDSIINSVTKLDKVIQDTFKKTAKTTAQAATSQANLEKQFTQAYQTLLNPKDDYPNVAIQALRDKLQWNEKQFIKILQAIASKDGNRLNTGDYLEGAYEEGREFFSTITLGQKVVAETDQKVSSHMKHMATSSGKAFDLINEKAKNAIDAIELDKLSDNVKGGMFSEDSWKKATQYRQKVKNVLDGLMKSYRENQQEMKKLADSYFTLSSKTNRTDEEELQLQHVINKRKELGVLNETLHSQAKEAVKDMSAVVGIDVKTDDIEDIERYVNASKKYLELKKKEYQTDAGTAKKHITDQELKRLNEYEDDMKRAYAIANKFSDIDLNVIGLDDDVHKLALEAEMLEDALKNIQSLNMSQTDFFKMFKKALPDAKALNAKLDEIKAKQHKEPLNQAAMITDAQKELVDNKIRILNERIVEYRKIQQSLKELETKKQRVETINKMLGTDSANDPELQRIKSEIGKKQKDLSAQFEKISKKTIKESFVDILGFEDIFQESNIDKIETMAFYAKDVAKAKHDLSKQDVISDDDVKRIQTIHNLIGSIDQSREKLFKNQDLLKTQQKEFDTEVRSAGATPGSIKIKEINVNKTSDAINEITKEVERLHNLVSDIDFRKLTDGEKEILFKFRGRGSKETDLSEKIVEMEGKIKEFVHRVNLISPQITVQFKGMFGNVGHMALSDALDDLNHQVSQVDQSFNVPGTKKYPTFSDALDQADVTDDERVALKALMQDTRAEFKDLTNDVTRIMREMSQLDPGTSNYFEMFKDLDQQLDVAQDRLAQFENYYKDLLNRIATRKASAIEINKDRPQRLFQDTVSDNIEQGISEDNLAHLLANASPIADELADDHADMARSSADTADNMTRQVNAAKQIDEHLTHAGKSAFINQELFNELRGPQGKSQGASYMVALNSKRWAKTRDSLMQERINRLGDKAYDSDFSGPTNEKLIPHHTRYRSNIFDTKPEDVVWITQAEHDAEHLDKKLKQDLDRLQELRKQMNHMISLFKKTQADGDQTLSMEQLQGSANIEKWRADTNEVINSLTKNMSATQTEAIKPLIQEFADGRDSMNQLMETAQVSYQSGQATVTKSVGDLQAERTMYDDIYESVNAIQGIEKEDIIINDKNNKALNDTINNQIKLISTQEDLKAVEISRIDRTIHGQKKILEQNIQIAKYAESSQRLSMARNAVGNNNNTMYIENALKRVTAERKAINDILDGNSNVTVQAGEAQVYEDQLENLDRQEYLLKAIAHQREEALTLMDMQLEDMEILESRAERQIANDKAHEASLRNQANATEEIARNTESIARKSKGLEWDTMPDQAKSYMQNDKSLQDIAADGNRHLAYVKAIQAVWSELTADQKETLKHYKNINLEAESLADQAQAVKSAMGDAVEITDAERQAFRGVKAEAEQLSTIVKAGIKSMQFQRETGYVEKLQDLLNRLSNTSKLTKEELADIRVELDKMSQTALTTSRRTQAFTDDVEMLKDHVISLIKRLQFKGEYESVDEMRKHFNYLNDSVNVTEDQLNAARKALARYNDEINSGKKKQNAFLSSFGKIDAFAMKWSMYMSGLAATLFVAQQIGMAIQQLIAIVDEFNKDIENTADKFHLSGEEAKMMGVYVREIATQSGKSMSEIVDEINESMKSKLSFGASIAKQFEDIDEIDTMTKGIQNVRNVFEDLVLEGVQQYEGQMIDSIGEITKYLKAHEKDIIGLGNLLVRLSKTIAGDVIPIIHGLVSVLMSLQDVLGEISTGGLLVSTFMGLAGLTAGFGPWGALAIFIGTELAYILGRVLDDSIEKAIKDAKENLKSTNVESLLGTYDSLDNSNMQPISTSRRIKRFDERIQAAKEKDIPNFDSFIKDAKITDKDAIDELTKYYELYINARNDFAELVKKETLLKNKQDTAPGQYEEVLRARTKAQGEMNDALKEYLDLGEKYSINPNAAPISTNSTYKTKVMNWKDGDTLNAQLKGQLESIRLAFVDFPESLLSGRTDRKLGELMTSFNQVLESTVPSEHVVKTVETKWSDYGKRIQDAYKQINFSKEIEPQLKDFEHTTSGIFAEFNENLINEVGGTPEEKEQIAQQLVNRQFDLLDKIKVQIDNKANNYQLDIPIQAQIIRQSADELKSYINEISNITDSIDTNGADARTKMIEKLTQFNNITMKDKISMMGQSQSQIHEEIDRLGTDLVDAKLAVEQAKVSGITEAITKADANLDKALERFEGYITAVSKDELSFKGLFASYLVRAQAPTTSDIDVKTIAEQLRGVHKRVLAEIENEKGINVAFLPLSLRLGEVSREPTNPDDIVKWKEYKKAYGEVIDQNGKVIDSTSEVGKAYQHVTMLAEKLSIPLRDNYRNDPLGWEKAEMFYPALATEIKIANELELERKKIITDPEVIKALEDQLSTIQQSNEAMAFLGSNDASFQKMMKKDKIKLQVADETKKNEALLKHLFETSPALQQEFEGSFTKYLVDYRKQLVEDRTKEQKELTTFLNKVEDKVLESKANIAKIAITKTTNAMNLTAQDAANTIEGMLIDDEDISGFVKKQLDSIQTQSDVIVQRSKEMEKARLDKELLEAKKVEAILSDKLKKMEASDIDYKTTENEHQDVLNLIKQLGVGQAAALDAYGDQVAKAGIDATNKILAPFGITQDNLIGDLHKKLNDAKKTLRSEQRKSGEKDNVDQANKTELDDLEQQKDNLIKVLEAMNLSEKQLMQARLIVEDTYNIESKGLKLKHLNNTKKFQKDELALYEKYQKTMLGDLKEYGGQYAALEKKLIGAQADEYGSKAAIDSLSSSMKKVFTDQGLSGQELDKALADAIHNYKKLVEDWKTQKIFDADIESQQWQGFFAGLDAGMKDMQQTWNLKWKSMGKLAHDEIMQLAESIEGALAKSFSAAFSELFTSGDTADYDQARADMDYAQQSIASLEKQKQLLEDKRDRYKQLAETIPFYQDKLAEVQAQLDEVNSTISSQQDVYADSAKIAEDTYSDLASKLNDIWGSLWDSVKQSFFDMLGEMIARAAMEKIIVPVVMDLFSSGSSGSSMLGGLAGLLGAAVEDGSKAGSKSGTSDAIKDATNKGSSFFGGDGAMGMAGNAVGAAGGIYGAYKGFSSGSALGIAGGAVSAGIAIDNIVSMMHKFGLTELEGIGDIFTELGFSLDMFGESVDKVAKVIDTSYQLTSAEALRHGGSIYTSTSPVGPGGYASGTPASPWGTADPSIPGTPSSEAAGYLGFDSEVLSDMLDAIGTAVAIIKTAMSAIKMVQAWDGDNMGAKFTSTVSTTLRALSLVVSWVPYAGIVLQVIAGLVDMLEGLSNPKISSYTANVNFDPLGQQTYVNPTGGAYIEPEDRTNLINGIYEYFDQFSQITIKLFNDASDSAKTFITSQLAENPIEFNYEWASAWSNPVVLDKLYTRLGTNSFNTSDNGDSGHGYGEGDFGGSTGQGENQSKNPFNIPDEIYKRAMQTMQPINPSSTWDSGVYTMQNMDSYIWDQLNPIFTGAALESMQSMFKDVLSLPMTQYLSGDALEPLRKYQDYDADKYSTQQFADWRRAVTESDKLLYGYDLSADIPNSSINPANGFNPQHGLEAQWNIAKVDYDKWVSQYGLDVDWDKLMNPYDPESPMYNKLLRDKKNYQKAIDIFDAIDPLYKEAKQNNINLKNNFGFDVNLDIADMFQDAEKVSETINNAAFAWIGLAGYVDESTAMIDTASESFKRYIPILEKAGFSIDKIKDFSVDDIGADAFNDMKKSLLEIAMGAGMDVAGVNKSLYVQADGSYKLPDNADLSGLGIPSPEEIHNFLKSALSDNDLFAIMTADWQAQLDSLTLDQFIFETEKYGETLSKIGNEFIAAGKAFETFGEGFSHGVQELSEFEGTDEELSALKTKINTWFNQQLIELVGNNIDPNQAFGLITKSMSDTFNADNLDLFNSDTKAGFQTQIDAMFKDVDVTAPGFDFSTWLSDFNDFNEEFAAITQYWSDINTEIDSFLNPQSDYATQVSEWSDKFDGYIANLRQLGFSEEKLAEIETKRWKVLEKLRNEELSIIAGTLDSIDGGDRADSITRKTMATRYGMDASNYDVGLDNLSGWNELFADLVNMSEDDLFIALEKLGISADTFGQDVDFVLKQVEALEAVLKEIDQLKLQRSGMNSDQILLSNINTDYGLHDWSGNSIDLKLSDMDWLNDFFNSVDTDTWNKFLVSLGVAPEKLAEFTKTILEFGDSTDTATATIERNMLRASGASSNDLNLFDFNQTWGGGKFDGMDDFDLSMLENIRDILGSGVYSSEEIMDILTDLEGPFKLSREQAALFTTQVIDLTDSMEDAAEVTNEWAESIDDWLLAMRDWWRQMRQEIQSVREYDFTKWSTDDTFDNLDEISNRLNDMFDTKNPNYSDDNLNVPSTFDNVDVTALGQAFQEIDPRIFDYGYGLFQEGSNYLDTLLADAGLAIQDVLQQAGQDNESYQTWLDANYQGDSTKATQEDWFRHIIVSTKDFFATINQAAENIMSDARSRITQEEQKAYDTSTTKGLENWKNKKFSDLERLKPYLDQADYEQLTGEITQAHELMYQDMLKATQQFYASMVDLWGELNELETLDIKRIRLGRAYGMDITPEAQTAAIDWFKSLDFTSDVGFSAFDTMAENLNLTSNELWDLISGLVELEEAVEDVADEIRQFTADLMELWGKRQGLDDLDLQQLVLSIKFAGKGTFPENFSINDDVMDEWLAWFDNLTDPLAQFLEMADQLKLTKEELLEFISGLDAMTTALAAANDVTNETVLLWAKRRGMSDVDLERGKIQLAMQDKDLLTDKEPLTDEILYNTLDWFSNLDHYDEFSAMASVLKITDAELLELITSMDSLADSLAAIKEQIADLFTSADDYIFNIHDTRGEYEKLIQDMNDKFDEFYDQLVELNASSEELVLINEKRAEAEQMIWTRLSYAIADKAQSIQDEYDIKDYINMGSDIDGDGNVTKADYYLSKLAEIASQGQDLGDGLYGYTPDQIDEYAGLLDLWRSAAIEVAEGQTDVTDSLDDLINSIDDLIKDIKYGELNVALPKYKAQESQQDYQALLANALSEDATEQDIADYTGFVQQYLQLQQDRYKSSNEYQDIYDAVMNDMANVKDNINSDTFENNLLELTEETNELLDQINRDFLAYMQQLIELSDNQGVIDTAPANVDRDVFQVDPKAEAQIWAEVITDAIADLYAGRISSLNLGITFYSTYGMQGIIDLMNEVGANSSYGIKIALGGLDSAMVKSFEEALLLAIELTDTFGANSDVALNVGMNLIYKAIGKDAQSAYDAVQAYAERYGQDSQITITMAAVMLESTQVLDSTQAMYAKLEKLYNDYGEDSPLVIGVIAQYMDRFKSEDGFNLDYLTDTLDDMAKTYGQSNPLTIFLANNAAQMIYDIEGENGLLNVIHNLNEKYGDPTHPIMISAVVKLAQTLDADGVFSEDELRSLLSGQGLSEDTITTIIAQVQTTLHVDPSELALMEATIGDLTTALNEASLAFSYYDIQGVNITLGDAIVALGLVMDDARNALWKIESHVTPATSSLGNDMLYLHQAIGHVYYAISDLNNAANVPGYAMGGIASGPESGYAATLHGTELVVSPKTTYPATVYTPNQSNEEEVALLKELVAIEQEKAGQPMKITVEVGNEEFDAYIDRRADNVRVKAEKRNRGTKKSV